MADEPMWIEVVNWDRFQHYKSGEAGNRRATWIKSYTELLRKDEYLGLPPRTRSLLHGLWLLYADSRCAIRAQTSRLSRALNQQVTRSDLEALVNAGFIRFSSSKPLEQNADSSSESLGLARADAPSPEAEAEKEKTSLTAVARSAAPAHDDLAFGLGTEGMGYALRLSSTLRHKDERTVDVITSFVGKLPPAAFETVREKIAEGNGHIANDAGYAVAELQRMVDTNQYAA